VVPVDVLLPATRGDPALAGGGHNTGLRAGEKGGKATAEGTADGNRGRRACPGGRDSRHGTETAPQEDLGPQEARGLQLTLLRRLQPGRPRGRQEEAETGGDHGNLLGPPQVRRQGQTLPGPCLWAGN